MQTNTTLEVLELNGNVIDYEGVGALAEALTQNTSLRTLGLRWGGAGRAVVGALLAAAGGPHPPIGDAPRSAVNTRADRSSLPPLPLAATTTFRRRVPACWRKPSSRTARCRCGLGAAGAGDVGSSGGGSGGHGWGSIAAPLPC